MHIVQITKYENEFVVSSNLTLIMVIIINSNCNNINKTAVAYNKSCRLYVVFTARCYAERGYEIACRLSVRLSVCDA